MIQPRASAEPRTLLALLWAGGGCLALLACAGEDVGAPHDAPQPVATVTGQLTGSAGNQSVSAGLLATAEVGEVAVGLYGR